MNTHIKVSLFSHLYLGIVIAIVIAVVIMSSWLMHCLHSKTKVKFPSVELVQNFLMSDSDGFIKNFSSLDLEARWAESREAYVKTAFSAIRAFTADEKTRLISLCSSADLEMRRLFDETTIGWVREMRPILKMPWFICKSTSDYEGGLPHTRDRYIFLSSIPTRGAEAVALLIHEKVHVFQRFHERLVADFLKEFKYEKTTKTFADIRANPDTDGKIYRRDGRIVAWHYRAHPISITDGQVVQEKELKQEQEGANTANTTNRTCML